jgi:hypothetical protein
MPHGPSQPIMQHAAAALSRRRSLTSLGGVILAATVPGLSLVEAKKKGKNKKRKKRTNRRTRDCPECPECPEEDPPVDQCVPEEAPCRDFAEQVCAHLYPPGQPTLVCALAATLCCLKLGECEGEGIFACLARQLPDN